MSLLHFEKIVFTCISLCLIVGSLVFFWFEKRSPSETQQKAALKIEKQSGTKDVYACTNLPSDIMFIIDQSSSVLISSGNNPGRDAVLEFVDQLAARNTQNRIGVVTFTIQEQTNLHQTFTTDYQAVKNALNRLEDNDPDGPSSCIECGIRLSNSEFLNESLADRKHVVVLLTDGSANRTKSGSKDKGLSVDLAYDAAQDGYAQSGIVFYTVGIGDKKNSSLLVDIADDTDGEFYDSKSESELDAIFDEITDEIDGCDNKPGTWALRGTVFVDSNRNGVQDTGEADYWGAQLSLSNGARATTNSLGDYAFANLATGTYTVTLQTISGMVPTTPNPVTVTISANRIVNFGINAAFSISGNVFVDVNKNGIKDAGEANYTGTPSIGASRGTVTTATGGTYRVSNLAPGSVTTSLGSIPPDYEMTSPRNGPPPSFQVDVGPACNPRGAPGAICQ